MKANELGTFKSQMRSQRSTANIPKTNSAESASQHSQSNMLTPVNAIDTQTPPTVMVPRKFLSDDEINIWNAPEDHPLAFYRQHKPAAYYKMIYWD